MTYPVPTPANYVPGVPTSAAFQNAQVRDSNNFWGHRPHALLYQATAQSIPNNTATPCTFDGAVVDDYGGHSTVTNPSRYTAPRAGWYSFGGLGAFQANTAGVRACALRLDGTTYQYGSQQILPTIGVSGINTNVALPVTEVFMNVGDYVELMLTQTSGAALNTIVSLPNESALVVRWEHD